jgi:G-patch domain
MTTPTGDPARVAGDTRNLHWKQNNVGSKLLQKMGWVDGQAVGKRQRNRGQAKEDERNRSPIAVAPETETVNAAHNSPPPENSSQDFVSSEGLRIMKRRDGLGLGASSQDAAVALSSSSNAVHNLSSVLQQLQAHHPSTEKKKKKRKKETSTSKTEKRSSRKRSRDEASETLSTKSASAETSAVVFATNKATHHRVRAAKFQARTAEDYKAIFGSAEAPLSLANVPPPSTQDVAERVKAKKEKRGKRNKSDE